MDGDWTMMCMPSSGHVEVYEMAPEGRRLVKVSPSVAGAGEFLQRAAAEDDTILIVRPAGGADESSQTSMTGAELGALNSTGLRSLYSWRPATVKAG